mmetsp:Transcript_24102/g.36457  ORF Transcript_24102/g.36457 Transcript_24102/m.36457 type:complete len:114 (-) Transcript_24102:65-406(-)
MTLIAGDDNSGGIDLRFGRRQKVDPIVQFNQWSNIFLAQVLKVRRWQVEAFRQRRRVDYFVLLSRHRLSNPSIEFHGHEGPLLNEFQITHNIESVNLQSVLNQIVRGLKFLRS